MPAREAAFRAVVAALKERKKTVAVVEATCGGLISSSIMGVEGSSAVYYGGTVAYNTRRCKPLLLDDDALHASLVEPAIAPRADGESAGDYYKRTKAHWTARTAVAYCEAMGTDYAVAEGGAAGPTFRPDGLDRGFSALAVAARDGDGGVGVVRTALVESPHAKRGANMELFATAAARELLGAVTAGEGLDRKVELRTDGAAVDARRASGDARFVVCARGRMLFASETALALLTRGEADGFGDSGAAVFLGEAGGRPLFALEAARSLDDARFVDARTQAPFLDATENEVALCAAALTTWRRSNGFCAKCGGATALTMAGHCAKCVACGSVSFPRTDPAVIVAVSSLDNSKILLARSPRHPPGMFTTLAGFVEAGETFEKAVAREVHEESGAVVSDVAYLKSQPWPFPSRR
ncbi:NAD+ diphosphatase [Aureococcus anophagefferens]|uniref:NAD(+) diphosphatase n=1 Tax=Aureococcus anophagefferens TaxID=44056 RepID=A0ABR1G3S6_AURAN